MRRSPSIASSLADDFDVYLVLDELAAGSAGLARDRRTRRRPGNHDRRSHDRAVLFAGARGRIQHSRGLVWDVSEEITEQLMLRINQAYSEISRSLEEFLDRYAGGRPVQLPLPLQGSA
jgi:hypothetical protein